MRNLVLGGSDRGVETYIDLLPDSKFFAMPVPPDMRARVVSFELASVAVLVRK